MAHKSGLSHGMAAVLSLIVAQLLVAYLKPWFPNILGKLEALASTFADWLGYKLDVKIEAAIFIPALVAFFLAFLWGLLYHHIRHGERK